MSNRLDCLIRDAKRRFVETFGRNNRSLINLKTIDPCTGMVPIHAHGALGIIHYPEDWLFSLLESSARFQSLYPGCGKSDDLLLSDVASSIECSARVVMTLWSALESHWGLSLKKDHAANWQQLVRSTLWYVPMCGYEQEFIPFMKYQLSLLFAKGEGQAELPEVPDKFRHKGGLVLLDWLGRFFKSRCFGDKLKNKEWRNTVLHGIKKGLPQMGTYFLQKNAEGMRKRLTKVAVTPEDILEAVDRTAREIFPKGIIWEDWNKVDPFVGISDHACYERNRSGQGVLGHLFDLDMGERCTPHRQLSTNDLGGMLWDPSRGEVREFRFPSWLPDQIYAREQRDALCDYSTGSAAVKPIFEPLKIRMISAGDYKSNGLYSRLQKTLWQGLQRFPQFNLTGKSVECSDVEWIRSMTLNSRYSPISDFWLWVSGDYSAATDNLNQDASKEACNALSGDPITQKVLVKGMMETTIDFNFMKELNGTDFDFSKFKMINGQLMGSVFSFPILCLINIAVYRKVLEAYTKMVWALKDLPVKCNGDDILFLSNPEFYELWCSTIKLVGFEKSVGKNYVSSDTAVINSTYFDARADRPVTKVPYLNMGWATGVMKCGGQMDRRSDDADEDYPIEKIGAQLEKAYEQWVVDEEYNHADLSPKEKERRRLVFLRYREEIRIWNWDRVVKLGAIAGGGPCGLNLTDQVDEERLKFSFWAYLNKDRTNKGGCLTSIPKTLVPWKIVQHVGVTNYHELSNEFRKQRRTFDLEQIMHRYWAKINQTLYTKFEETRYSVGAL